MNTTPAVSGLIAQINPLWGLEMTWDADKQKFSISFITISGLGCMQNRCGIDLQIVNLDNLPEKNNKVTQLPEISCCGVHSLWFWLCVIYEKGAI